MIHHSPEYRPKTPKRARNLNVSPRGVVQGLIVLKLCHCYTHVGRRYKTCVHSKLTVQKCSGFSIKVENSLKLTYSKNRYFNCAN